jgi:hypothetical protein
MPARPLRRLTLVVSVALIACWVAPSRAQEKKKDPAEVLKTLEQMLNDYRDENATLKARVKDLEGQVQTLKQSRVMNVVPQQQGAGTQQQPPPSWKPFQFNGGTYYIVPLAANGGGAGNEGVSSGTFSLTPGQGAVRWTSPAAGGTAPAAAPLPAGSAAPQSK